jgi:protease-4
MAIFGGFPPSNNDADSKDTSTWERKVIQDLAFAAIKEQRASRRWGYVFKAFIVLYLVAIVIMANLFADISLY